MMDDLSKIFIYLAIDCSGGDLAQCGTLGAVLEGVHVRKRVGY